MVAQPLALPPWDVELIQSVHWGCLSYIFFLGTSLQCTVLIHRIRKEIITKVYVAEPHNLQIVHVEVLLSSFCLC